MKERLGIGDWLAAGGHAATGGLVVAAGRAVQAAGIGVAALGLWPSLASVVDWLRTGAWTVPTPMRLAPGATRAVAGATDWVVIRDVLAWLAVHHVLFALLPVALLVFLAGTGIVTFGHARAGRARDIVSLSLRDEYRLREGWARWRPRLVVFLAAALAAAAGIVAWVTFFRP